MYVAGELYLAQQLIFRALAIGERVLIRTDRPHSWEHLVTTIGNPERLTIATETHQPDADFTATVVDGVLAPAPHAGITTVYLTGDPLGWPDTRPELSIHQPGAVGNRITLRTGTTREELTLVSIPSETTYIGRPRGHTPRPGEAQPGYGSDARAARRCRPHQSSWRSSRPAASTAAPSAVSPAASNLRLASWKLTVSRIDTMWISATTCRSCSTARRPPDSPP